MISKRLKESAKYLNGFYCLADCGTDHGYLPIYAIKQGFVQKAIASDNKEYPLKNAITNIELEQVTVETLLADGLSYLNPEIDVVSILGMGGRLIVDILKNADVKHVKRFVLSPNSDQEALRKHLQDHQFQIVAEEIIKDKSKFYQIIVAEPGDMKLSPVELEFGPIIIKDSTDIFKEYIHKLIQKLEQALKQAKTKESQSSLEERIHVLKEVIS